MLAAGQAHGGIAQGIAHMLFEEVAYDDEANPLTTSLMDYAVSQRRGTAVVRRVPHGHAEPE